MIMTTVTREFFTFANNETEFYGELPPHTEKAFGLYLVMKGETTHLCSVQASSFAHGLQNLFIAKDGKDDALNEFIDRNGEWEYESVDDTYFGFIDHESYGDRVSETVEISIDVDDEIDESERLPDDVHREIWNEAIKYFSGNQHCPRCCF
jgi:hypothetical protein